MTGYNSLDEVITGLKTSIDMCETENQAETLTTVAMLTHIAGSLERIANHFDPVRALTPGDREELDRLRKEYDH